MPISEKDEFQVQLEKQLELVAVFKMCMYNFVCLWNFWCWVDSKNLLSFSKVMLDAHSDK